MCTCVSLCIHIEVRGDAGALVCHCALLFERGSFIELGTRLVSSKPSAPPVSAHSQTRVIGHA